MQGNWNKRIGRLQARRDAGTLRPGMQKRLGNLEQMQAQGQLQGQRQPLGNLQEQMQPQPQQGYMQQPQMPQYGAPQGNQQMMLQHSPEVMNMGFDKLQQMYGGMQMQQPQFDRQPSGFQTLPFFKRDY